MKYLVTLETVLPGHENGLIKYVGLNIQIKHYIYYQCQWIRH